MNELTKELLDALQALIDATWLEDSHAVQLDGTIVFSPYYDFSGINGWRRAEFRDGSIEFVVWPAGGAGGKWSAYSTYEGSLWFERFETEDEAREQCMKLLDRAMPNSPVSKARAAIAKAEAALSAPQPAGDDWIPWAGGECPVGGEVIVAVKDRNGNVDNYSKAHLYDWHRTGSPLDIIAYRVVKQ